MAHDMWLVDFFVSGMLSCNVDQTFTAFPIILNVANGSVNQAFRTSLFFRGELT